MGGGWFGGGGGGSFIGPTGGGGGWFGGGGGGGGGGLDWGPGSGGIGQTGPSSFRNRFSPESTHGGGGGILGNLLDQTAGVIHGLPGAVETAAQTGWHSLHLGYQNKAEAGWSPEKNWQALLSMLDISHKGDKYNQLVADKSVPKSERGFGGLLSSGWWHDPNEFGGAVLTPQYEAAKSDVVHAKNRDWHYFYEHPLNPILDIATVASLGGKAALIGGESSLAARGALGATAKEVATTERLLTDGNYARVLNQARTVQGRIRQRAFDNWSMRHPDARFIGASARMVPFLQRIVNNEMVMAHLPLRTFQHLTRNLTDEETFAFHVVVEPVTLDDRITFFEEEIARRMAQIGEREKRLAKKPPKTRPRIPPAIRPLEKYLDNLKSQGVRDAIEHPRQEFIDALEAGGRLEALAGKVLTDAGELNDAARKARVEMPARVMEPPAPPPPPAPPTFSGPVLPPTRPMTGGTPKPVMFTVRVPHLFWLEHEGLRSKIEGAIAAGTHETGELGHAHRVGKPGRTDLRIRMDEQALQNLIQHAKSDTHKAGMKVSAKATLRKLKAQEHIIHDARDRVTQELQWRHKRGDHWRVEDSDITVRPTGPESTPYQVWKDEEPISDRSHRTLAEAKRAAEKWVDYRRKEATLEAAQTQRAAEVAAGTAEPDPFIDSLDNPAGHDAAARANAALNSGPSVADARGAAFEESPVPHPTEHLPNEGELGGGATYTREESPGPGEEVFTIRLPGADHHPPDGSRGTRYYHQGEVQVHITHDAAYIGNLNIAKPFRRTAIKPMIESIGEFLDHAKVTRIVHDPEGMTHEGLRLWGGMVRRAGTGKLGDWKIAGEGVSVGKRVGVYAPGEGRGDLHQVGGAVLVRDEPAGWFDQKKPEAPPEAPAASVSEATTPPSEEIPPAAQTYELPERPAAETGMANVHGPMFPPHYRFPHMREGFTPGQFLSPQVERMLTPNTPLKQLRHNSGVLLTNALMITDPERVYGRDYLSTLRWQMIGLMKEHVLSKIARPLDPEMAATGFKPENWWYYLEKPVTIPRNVRMDAVLTHDRSVVDAVRRDEKLHDAAHGIVSKSLTDLLGPDAADKYTAERLSEMGVKMIPAAYGKHFRDEFTRTPKVIRMLYDRPMDVWRAITLNYRPAWLVNNFIGNGVMGLATYGPKGLAAYLRVLLSVEKSDEVFKLWGKTTRIPKLQRKFGEAFDEVAAQLHSAGLFGTQTHITHRGIHEGAMANLFDQKAMRLVDATAGELGRQVLRVGRGITKAEILFAEDTSREASFLVEAGADIKRLQETARKMGEGNISEIEALKRMDKASVERAVERVNDALGDFNNLNHFERTIVRRIIPFYSWFKVITKVSAKYLARYPARVLLMKNIAEARDASTDALLPRWLEGALGIGGVSKAGNQTVITTNGLNPYETLPQIQSGGWASLLTPVGGSALISASGRDPSFGAARDYYGLGASKDFGWKGDTTRFFGSLIQNLAPFQTAEKAHDYKGKLYAPHNYHAGPVTVDDFWLQYFGLPIRHIRTGEARRERGLR